MTGWSRAVRTWWHDVPGWLSGIVYVAGTLALTPEGQAAHPGDATAQTRQVLDLVRRLADAGLGVVLISHNMNDVMQVADKIVALYLGQTAAIVDAKDVTTTQVVELITTGRSGDVGLPAPASVGAASS